MVKFGDQLAAQTIPQWRSSYVSYDRLKRIIQRCQFAREKLIKIQTSRLSPDEKHPPAALDSDEEQVVLAAMTARPLSAAALTSPLRSGSAALSESSPSAHRRASAPASPSSTTASASDSFFLSSVQRHAAPDNEDEGSSLLLPPPALRQQPSAAASSTSSISLSSYGSMSTASSSPPSNSTSFVSTFAPAHSAIDIAPFSQSSHSNLARPSSSPLSPPAPDSNPSLNTASGLRQRSPSSPSSRSLSPTTLSRNSSKSRALSASPNRKSSTAVSPLLRHVNLKAYSSFASEDELAAADSLESEVSNFWSLVESDLNRVDSLFAGKVAQFTNVLDSFFPSASALSMLSNRGGLDKSPARGGEGEGGTTLQQPPVRPSPARARFNAVAGASLPDLRAVQTVYIELMQLQNFVKLNGVGFRKIVKKFDKTLNRETLPALMEKLKTRNFMSSKALDDLVDRTTSFISRDKLMVLQMEAKRCVQNPRDAPSELLSSTSWLSRLHYHLFSADYSFRPWAMFLCGVLSAAAAASEPFPWDPIANRAFSFLTLVVSMWVLKAIPFHATAMLIPPLAIFFDVLRDPASLTKTTLDAEAASKVILGAFFNHNTFLILGGYTVSASFSRCEVERRIAAVFQRRFHDKPHYFLLVMMLLGLFLSMWVSNHTAPVLCISVISPLIADFGADSRFVKALLLGIAFACNFGGMMTPISSMQNIVAIQQMNLGGDPMSFGAWILLSTPLCVLCTVLAWLLILVALKPNDIKSIPTILYEDDRPLIKPIIVCVCSAIAILLWATSSWTKSIFGDLGIISLLFMSVMFGTGVLTEVDLNSFAWHTLFLLGGSNVMGKVIESSHLLEHVVKAIQRALPESELLVMAEVFAITMLLATFVSHSVAAIVIVPILAHIGKSFNAVQEFSWGGALAVSAAMALPFSSFPNLYSLLVVDDFGQPYLSTRHFVLVGVPASVLALVFTVMQAYYLSHEGHAIPTADDAPAP